MRNRPHNDIRGRAHCELDTGDNIAAQREYSAFKNTAAHGSDLPPTQLERRERQSEREQKIYLDTREAAILLGLSESFLHKARHFGQGPPFYRVGRAIRYSKDDLFRWMAEHRVGGKRGR